MILLDTHFVLWAALQPERVPARAAKLIGERDTAVAFSAASLWELAIKSSIGRADFAVDATELRRWLLVEGFTELSIQPAHMLHLARLAWHHRDPIDRLLVAQAALEGLALWTADAAMKRYGSMIKVMAGR